jgi:hypothetical protein
MILVSIVTFLGAKARFQITLIIYATTCWTKVGFLGDPPIPADMVN